MCSKSLLKSWQLARSRHSHQTGLPLLAADLYFKHMRSCIVVLKLHSVQRTTLQRARLQWFHNIWSRLHVPLHITILTCDYTTQHAPSHTASLNLDLHFIPLPNKSKSKSDLIGGRSERSITACSTHHPHAIFVTFRN